MASPNSVIKKFVKVVNENTTEPVTEEDLPIEFYELKELARRKVLLRSSVRTDAILYFVVNSFLLALNLFVDFDHITVIYDVWAIWPIFAWSIFLLVHFIIYISDDLPDYRVKMLLIDGAIVLSVNPFLIYINYLANYYAELALISRYTPRLWWPWTGIISIIFFLVHAYFVYYVKDDEKLEKSIKREIMRITKKEGIDLKNIVKFREQMKDVEIETQQPSADKSIEKSK
jgi:hypothetical protein